MRLTGLPEVAAEENRASSWLNRAEVGGFDVPAPAACRRLSAASSAPSPSSPSPLLLLLPPLLLLLSALLLLPSLLLLLLAPLVSVSCCSCFGPAGAPFLSTPSVAAGCASPTPSTRFPPSPLLILLIPLLLPPLPSLALLPPAPRWLEELLLLALVLELVLAPRGDPPPGAPPAANPCPPT